MPDLTPEEVLAVLEQQAAEDAEHAKQVRDVMSMSAGQLSDELGQWGFDPAVVAQRAHALRGTAAKRAGGPPAARRQSAFRRVPAPLWIAGAVTVAATAGALVYASLHEREREPPPAPSAPPSAAPPAPAPSIDPRLLVASSAADLRRMAAVAYDEGDPTRCLALLDAARDKDPAGDATPEVQALREQARRQEELAPPAPTGKLK